MRTVLIGAVEGTQLALRSMVNAGAAPSLVVSLPLAKAGRHSDFVDVLADARALGIACAETANINSPELRDVLVRANPDHIFVIGWSQICSPEFMAIAKQGAIGFHPSLLPQDRGRAVIPWTILLGRKQTGSTMFWLGEGADDGDILAQRTFPVALDETARSLADKHLNALQDILADVLPRLARGERPRTAQNHENASYCSKRTPDDGLIDWTRSAADVWTLIRATGDPYPGAFTVLRGQRLVVWSAELVGEAPYAGFAGQIQRLDAAGALVLCGDGRHVLLKVVQLAGGERVPAAGVLKIHDRFLPGVGSFLDPVTKSK